MLLVVTGGARSGKSRVGHKLAEESGREVVVAVAGRADSDEEMRRRVGRHRRERPAGWSTLEVEDPVAWVETVPEDVCLLVDCLGSMVGRIVGAALVGAVELASDEAEARVDHDVGLLVRRLLERRGDTVVVTNEVGDGVVPTHTSGRLFRDSMGRANASLVASADAAWLVVAKRCIPLHDMPSEAGWPRRYEA